MTTPPGSLLATRRGLLTLLLLCAVQFLDVVDSSIMNVALPSIRRDLGFSAQGLQWVLKNRDRDQISVVNLSLGTDSTQSYKLSPLNLAVEKLWDKGIVLQTLHPEETYEPGCSNSPKFVVLILYLQRAHDESLRKSERVSANWL